MNVGQHRLELRDAKVSALYPIDAIVWVVHFPAERQALQLDEAHGTLEVGPLFGRHCLQPLHLVPARHTKLSVSMKLA